MYFFHILSVLHQFTKWKWVNVPFDTDVIPTKLNSRHILGIVKIITAKFNLTCVFWSNTLQETNYQSKLKIWARNWQICHIFKSLRAKLLYHSTIISKFKLGLCVVVKNNIISISNNSLIGNLSYWMETYKIGIFLHNKGHNPMIKVKTWI